MKEKENPEEMQTEDRKVYGSQYQQQHHARVSIPILISDSAILILNIFKTKFNVIKTVLIGTDTSIKMDGMWHFFL